MPLLFSLTSGSPTLAYIDPGTGSALIYVITGVIVSIYFAVRGLYYRLAELIFRSRYKRQKCNVAIHCEDPRYEITFLPVIRELARRGIEQTFFTMYERDDSFEELPGGVSHVPIAPGMVGYAYLNHLEAKLLVTTTPQLDVMTFRRSRRVEHYCHIPHALGECRYVRPYAYDFFDSVFCCGETLQNNIRRIESIRRLPAKQLFSVGIPHYDVLLQRASSAQTARKERPTVLIAPSWGPMSMFENIGIDFIRPLVRSYEVIVRPHPQMRVSQADLYAQVLALEGVSVDAGRTPGEAMAQADILISDISGIMHEFAFIYEKPVIVVDQELRNAGLEGQLLGGESDLKVRCRDFIVPTPPTEIAHLDRLIERTLKNWSSERISDVRSDLVYNFGGASTATATQLEGLLACL